MIKDLLDRPTPKRPTTLQFEGRVLLLLDDDVSVRSQLEDGVDLDVINLKRLRRLIQRKK